jgi:hypothetical protein
MDVNEFMIDRELDLLDLIPHSTTITYPLNVIVAVAVGVIPVAAIGIAVVVAKVVAV